MIPNSRVSSCASTPTHVGQTKTWRDVHHKLDLNPHARGADKLGTTKSADAVPQPPRTWGRRWWQSRSLLGLPSTPTHVGQTESIAAYGDKLPLNPHARGADILARHPVSLVTPQPPRTWGRPAQRADQNPGVPSTPTHVGQTDASLDWISPQVLNPHARGADGDGRGFW